eukprot:357676-Chlamydomonas_euryale.AAC.2
MRAHTSTPFAPAAEGGTSAATWGLAAAVARRCPRLQGLSGWLTRSWLPRALGVRWEAAGETPACVGIIGAESSGGLGKLPGGADELSERCKQCNLFLKLFGKLCVKLCPQR